MWRAFFMAVGITLCICGAECLVFEKADLHRKQEAAPPTPVMVIPYLSASVAPNSSGEIRFPEWAPWTLISAGAVVVCYSLTVAKS
jgi:hypothetical protein